MKRQIVQLLSALSLAFAAHAACAQTEPAPAPFKPVSGQAGKDVVWVPTPESLVEKMLDIAQVTAKDFVMDLGSGDGRNIIQAAKRGAQALGVEYNPDMVKLSRDSAAKANVADKAQFVQGDMFTADISKASVMALFLLPDNLRKLTPAFLNLRPGTRMVLNTFGIDGWTPDETFRQEENCSAWCSVLYYVVPAKVEGTWKLAQGELRLEQKFQMLSGTLSSGGKTVPISDGRLHGDRITFKAGGTAYEGIVDGATMGGIVRGGSAWNATRS